MQHSCEIDRTLQREYDDQYPTTKVIFQLIFLNSQVYYFPFFFCISENQVVEFYEYNEDLTTTEDSWTNRTCHHSCKLYRCKVGKWQLKNLSFVESNYSWSICSFHSRALAIRGVFVTRWVVRALINREMLLLIKWPSANVKLEIRSEWSARSRSLKAFKIL